MKNRPKFCSFVFCIAAASTLGSIIVSLASAEVRLTRPQDTIPTAYFGMHIHGIVVPRPGAAGPTPWPNVPFGSWRLLDSGVHWSNLEPSKGRWEFSTLDKYVSLAEQHNV